MILAILYSECAAHFNTRNFDCVVRTHLANVLLFRCGLELEVRKRIATPFGDGEISLRRSLRSQMVLTRSAGDILRGLTLHTWSVLVVVGSSCHVQFWS